MYAHLYFTPINIQYPLVLSVKLKLKQFKLWDKDSALEFLSQVFKIQFKSNFKLKVFAQNMEFLQNKNGLSLTKGKYLIIIAIELCFMNL